MSQDKLLIDVGSTYCKVAVVDADAMSRPGHSAPRQLQQHFRNFNRSIYDDLMQQCGSLIETFDPQDVYVCSSANGGLSTLIIGVSETFSLKYAINIAFNSGINIIDTILYQDIAEASVPSDVIDVVIIVGGIDSRARVFGDDLYAYLQKVDYGHAVYVGNATDGAQAQTHLPEVVLLPNIIDERLHIVEEQLKAYLTSLYQQDIVGKKDIKALYQITSNQIFSTPYVVNQTLSLLDARYAVTSPFILLDIGGATTDIHYAKDLVDDNWVTQNEFDRLVFKKLGVYKSRESLVFAARNNEFVGELLMHLNVTENIFDEHSDRATKVLMLLAIFLVLNSTSHEGNGYINLKLYAANAIVLTGGITKVLGQADVDGIIAFFYSKILTSNHRPVAILDSDYAIWTLGAGAHLSVSDRAGSKEINHVD